jgi:hypothetical protein
VGTFYPHTRQMRIMGVDVAGPLLRVSRLGMGRDSVWVEDDVHDEARKRGIDRVVHLVFLDEADRHRALSC